MSKRNADDNGPNAGGQPPIKKVQFEPHLIGPVSTLEELDIKVLQFRNKKLGQVKLALARAVLSLHAEKSIKVVPQRKFTFYRFSYSSLSWNSAHGTKGSI